MRSSFALRHTTLPVAVCMYRFSAATCIYDLVPPTIQTVTAPPSTTARSGTSRKRGSAALAIRPWNAPRQPALAQAAHAGVSATLAPTGANQVKALADSVQN